MQEKPSIQQLENFLIYGKVRNFAAAAHLANITQSAFSFQMKKLENILGVQLIYRQNRGSELTPAGEEFLEKLTPLLHDLDSLFQSIRSSGNKTTDIKVGALMSVGDVLMNRHIAYYKNQHPHVKISVYNLEAKDMLKKLEHGVIDVATSFILPQMDTEGYEKAFCYQEELVYYAPGLAIDTADISAQTIAKYPLAGYSPDYFMSQMLHQYFKDKCLHPKMEASLSTPYAIMHYCQSGNCGALLSEHLLNEMKIYSGYYHLKEPFYIDCYMLYKKENPKLDFITPFVKYLNQSFNRESTK